MVMNHSKNNRNKCDHGDDFGEWVRMGEDPPLHHDDCLCDDDMLSSSPSSSCTNQHDDDDDDGDVDNSNMTTTKTMIGAMTMVMGGD